MAYKYDNVGILHVYLILSKLKYILKGIVILFSLFLSLSL